MSDCLDIASEREEIARAAAITQARKLSGPMATGECLWCENPTGAGVRWCCVECRDEWEARRKHITRH